MTDHRITKEEVEEAWGDYYLKCVQFIQERGWTKDGGDDGSWGKPPDFTHLYSWDEAFQNEVDS